MRIMKTHWQTAVVILAILIFGAGMGPVNTARAKSMRPACAVDPAWFSAPSMPAEVKKSGSDGTSTFCDFYQFSWQAFAYLMAKPASGKAERNFLDTSQYYELEVNADGSPANSCDAAKTGKTIFLRAAKSTDGGTELIIPERIHQAGSQSVIYDQNGNVVYYDVRFSKNMCDVGSIASQYNFPGGTVELKGAWKVLTNADNPKDYITLDAEIAGQTETTTLGLVGFHLAVATPDHPEFVWATYEHLSNAPDCTRPAKTTGWSFASRKCTEDLQKGDMKTCNFNKAKSTGGLTGTPTQICRVYPYGSAPGDLDYQGNVDDIIALNNGVQPYLKDTYAVLKNYFNVGALWVSDINQGSVVKNQRGSLRLANTVAETVFQDVNLNSSFVSNCFGCHGYAGKGNPAKAMNTTSGSLSHIFDDIVAGLGACVDVQASAVINSQPDAEAACPKTCADASKYLKWNGQWTNQDAKTGAQLPMTVCGCCGK